MNKTERAVRLLVLLLRRRTLTTREAAAELDISIRLARGDLKALAQVAPVRFVEDGRRSRWILEGEVGLGPLDRLLFRHLAALTGVADLRQRGVGAPR